MFLVCVFAGLIKQILAHSWLSAIAFAGLGSFLTVGIFGFLFDAARMAMSFS